MIYLYTYLFILIKCQLLILVKNSLDQLQSLRTKKKKVSLSKSPY